MKKKHKALIFTTCRCCFQFLCSANSHLCHQHSDVFLPYLSLSHSLDWSSHISLSICPSNLFSKFSDFLSLYVCLPVFLSHLSDCRALFQLFPKTYYLPPPPPHTHTPFPPYSSCIPSLYSVQNITHLFDSLSSSVSVPPVQSSLILSSPPPPPPLSLSHSLCVLSLYSRSTLPCEL